MEPAVNRQGDDRELTRKVDKTRNEMQKSLLLCHVAKNMCESSQVTRKSSRSLRIAARKARNKAEQAKSETQRRRR